MEFMFLASFMLVLVFIGIFTITKTKTANDFILGGRNVGPWMSAFAYGTAYFSAVLFIGYAGKIGWGFGLSALWIALGNSLIGCLAAWKILAKRTKDMTTRLNVMTMPQFLHARYDSPGLKVFAALVIFIFLVPYSASVYMGLSYLFEQVFNIPYTYVLFGMAGLTAFYLIAGGYFAVAITDLFQGILMIVGVFFMVYFVTSSPQVGGFTNIVASLRQVDPYLTAFTTPPNWRSLIFLIILTSFGSWGLPQMIQKFYAIRDEKAIRPATIISTLFAMLITGSAYLVGALSRLFFCSLPVLDGKTNVDLLIPQIIAQTLPGIVAALILILILAASMSTLASLVLTSSSSFVIDLLADSLNLKIAKEKPVLMLRLFCLVFIGISLLVALNRPALILGLMGLSWGTVAGVFLAPYVLGLYWRGTTKAGAWAGALSGLILSLGLTIYFKFSPDHLPMIGTIAMVVPLLVVPFVSLITDKLPDSHLDILFPNQLTQVYCNIGKPKEAIYNDLG